MRRLAVALALELPDTLTALGYRPAGLVASILTTRLVGH